MTSFRCPSCGLWLDEAVWIDVGVGHGPVVECPECGERTARFKKGWLASKAITCRCGEGLSLVEPDLSRGEEVGPQVVCPTCDRKWRLAAPDVDFAEPSRARGTSRLGVGDIPTGSASSGAGGGESGRAGAAGLGPRRQGTPGKADPYTGHVWERAGVDRSTGQETVFVRQVRTWYGPEGDWPVDEEAEEKEESARKKARRLEKIRKAKGEKRKRAGELPRPLEPGWWKDQESCSDGERCGKPTCPRCRARDLLRQVMPSREAWAVARQEHGATVWMVTVTRRKRIETREDADRFRASLAAVDAALRAAGVWGAWWVLHWTRKAEEGKTSIPCCGDEGCPLCNGSGLVVVGHLHAHAVCVLREGDYIAWEWLQGLQDARRFDPELGNIDVRTGEGGEPDAMFGYTASYMGAKKERRQLQAAALRAIYGPRANMAWRTGALRGAVKVRRQTSWIDTPTGELVISQVANHLVKEWRPSIVPVGEMVDTGQALPRQVFREQVRRLRARGYAVRGLRSRWRRDAERWQKMKGWRADGKRLPEQPAHRKKATPVPERYWRVGAVDSPRSPYRPKVGQRQRAARSGTLQRRSPVEIPMRK